MPLFYFQADGSKKNIQKIVTNKLLNRLTKKRINDLENFFYYNTKNDLRWENL